MKRNQPFTLNAFYLFLLLSAFAIIGLAQTPPPKATPKPLPREDTQVWNETQFQIPVSQRVTLNFLQFGRIGTNVSFRSDTRTGAGIIIKFNKYYSIQPTYVYQYGHPGAGRKAFSHRLYVDNLIKVPVTRKVLTNNRIRFERIVRHGKADAWNFRFRPGIEVPLKLGDYRFSLIASHEMFYDTFFKAWTRHRSIVGVSKKLTNQFTMDVFYQRQRDQYARPGNHNALGTTLKFKIDREK